MTVYIVFKEFWVKHYIGTGIKLQKRKFDRDRISWEKANEALTQILGGDLIEGDDPEFREKFDLSRVFNLVPQYIKESERENLRMDLCGWFDDLHGFTQRGTLTSEDYSCGSGTLSLECFPVIMSRLNYCHEKVWFTPLNLRYKWLDRLNEAYESDLIESIEFNV